MPKLKCQFKEMKRFERNLLELSRDVSKILKPTVYDGAGVAATALRETVGGLACVSDVDSIHAWRASTPTIICRSQKDGLLEALKDEQRKCNDPYDGWSECQVALGFVNTAPTIIPAEEGE